MAARLVSSSCCRWPAVVARVRLVGQCVVLEYIDQHVITLLFSISPACSSHSAAELISRETQCGQPTVFLRCAVCDGLRVCVVVTNSSLQGYRHCLRRRLVSQEHGHSVSGLWPPCSPRRLSYFMLRSALDHGSSWFAVTGTVYCVDLGWVNNGWCDMVPNETFRSIHG